MPESKSQRTRIAHVQGQEKMGVLARERERGRRWDRAAKSSPVTQALAGQSRK